MKSSFNTYNSKLTKSVILGLSLSCLAFSCSDDDDDNATETQLDAQLTTVLGDYSQMVAVATYSDMATKAKSLETAVNTFNSAPNQESFNAVGDAWIAVREPWEASEAFLFGPAEFGGLDPALDSWPVDQNQLDNVLNSSFELTAEFVAEGLGNALKGYHTIEFLVFRDGQVRTFTDLTEREKEYLVAVTDVFEDDASTLHAGWETDGFASEFASAGKEGSRYQTQLDAVNEIFEGMIGICDEVANGKIADPYDEQDTQLVESQFSFNSLKDFENNIKSVQNAYLGGYHNGLDGTGLDTYVSSKNATMDTNLKNQIEDAIAKIKAIPVPFRDNLDKNTEIEAAQTSIREIQRILEEEVKPLVNN
ncbi:MAG: peptidase M75 [Calditrichaeota bacterium]|nr:MAG: peptidase M75 [Calditrichota bacterium]